METRFKDYIISDDQKWVDLKKAHAMLSNTYWANKRTLEQNQKAFDHSICISVYTGREQVGFARAITDHATFAWLADVVVDEDHRGQGIGKAIVDFIQNHPVIPSGSQYLITKDAHGLYEQYGFSTEACMVKRRPVRKE